MKQETQQKSPAQEPSFYDHLKYAATVLAGLTLPSLGAEYANNRAEPPAIVRNEHDSPQGKIVTRRLLPGESEITAALVKDHVTFLAKDEHKGRDTGKGQLEGPVTEYVEKIWKDLGLKPMGNAEGTSFRQPFTIRTWDDAAAPKYHHHGLMGHEANERGVAISADGRPINVSDAERTRALSATALKTHNLVAFIEGSDPVLRKEIIVVGAHLDHIGEGTPGADGDGIYNGADDNASGSSAVLAISKALAKAKQEGNGPSRSVMLILFSGEELGLLGSQYFVQNPTVPIGNIKGMINLDMIGRLDPKQVSIFDKGRDGHPNPFHAVHDTSGTKIERIDHNADNLVARSDQWAFYKKDIPVMFFFEGYDKNGEMNPDYHGRKDHADRIDSDKVSDIARLAYRHLLAAANRKE